ncbi:MAG: hypothetical protein P794_06090 [Epsilonproteobacteria bacterium (ex Lamellibrachia satsuma)]|nr:MAG: hypothetical protein P794_06090 [Epsilonproteobacteria bacterium (ex Lamellibrachia satsuma)]
MSTLIQEIEKHIKKLVRPLKETEVLLEVLKVKLTKKEFKLLKAWAEETPIDEIRAKLNLDKERYGELSSKLIKKLNQEKLKQEMCI